MSSAMSELNRAPFSKSSQLCEELERNESSSAMVTKPAALSLPGHPHILLDEPEILESFLYNEFCSEDLEVLAPYLWMMSTQSSQNVNPLHQQRVKGRDIVVTESPRLHLLWIHNRVFIKPLPKYLLSHVFWDVLASPSPLRDRQERIFQASKGYLRTWRYLIQHESDFVLAKQDHLRLIPEEVTWAAFCQFLNEIGRIKDDEVSARYNFGELRLSRLNLYAPLLLRRFYYEQVYWEYADYFSRFYGPVLFLFTIITTILNAMQVKIAVEDVSAFHWASLRFICHWFSTLSLAATIAIAVMVMLLWIWMILDEWFFAIRCRWKIRKDSLSLSRC